MQLSNLFTLLPLTAATVSGGVLPRDAAPGIYAIKVVNGTDQPAVKVGDLYYGPVTEITARGSTLDKRDSNGGTGRWFPNHDDYNICTNTWRNLLQNGGKLEGKTKYVIRNGVAELAGCNYNSKSLLLPRESCTGHGPCWHLSTCRPRLTAVAGGQWAPPPQTVDQFNGLMDAVYGAWNTGWVFSDPYQWTFWRDISGKPNYCSNLG
jgi:hypothetical protein